MEKIELLYAQWLTEKNKGHYAKHIDKDIDVLSLFGNQDFVLSEIDKLLNFYGMVFKGRVLDVGCSMGGFLFSLYDSQKFEFIAGVDIDKTAVGMAKEYKRLKKIDDEKVFVDVASIFKLPFKDKTFDFIVMKDIGEHLESKEKLEYALIELKRVLADEGYIFIETPNYLFPMEVHLKIPMLPYFSTKENTKLFATIFKKDPNFIDHLNFTTPKMFEDIFKKNKLNYKNAYEEYKIPYIIKNHDKLSKRFKFVGGFLRAIDRLDLNKYVVSLFKLTKMYPSLWYLVNKK